MLVEVTPGFPVTVVGDGYCGGYWVRLLDTVTVIVGCGYYGYCGYCGYCLWFRLTVLVDTMVM